MRAFGSKTSKFLDGYGADTIADWLHIHVTTARRYKRGEEPSYAAMQLLELRISGDLGIVDQDWRGWKIRNGKLISPDNMEFTTGDILAIPFVNQLVASYQTTQRFQLQADWIAERWVIPQEAAVA